MSGLGIGRRNSGWLRVVGMWVVGAVGDGVSPILGMFMVRTRWSVWLVSVVLMVASVGWKCDVGGRRRNQWSNGEFVGVNVGVWKSPMWMREVALQIPLGGCSRIYGFGVGSPGGLPP